MNDISKNLERFINNEEVYVIAHRRAGGNLDKRYTRYATNWRYDAFATEELARKALGNFACTVFESKDFCEYSPECNFEELAKVVADLESFEDDVHYYSVESIEIRSLIDGRFPLNDESELGDLITDLQCFEVCEVK